MRDSLLSEGDLSGYTAPKSNRLYKMGCLVVFSLFLIASIVVTVILVNNDNDSSSNNDDEGDSTLMAPVWENGTAQLVESIPEVNFSLPKIQGVGTTYEAHMDLINNATKSLDISVMYWNLIADSDDGSFTTQQLQAFGANEGNNIYNSLLKACERGIQIRILQDNSSSFSPPTELWDLETNCSNIEGANPIQIHYWNASNFYKGGVMHMKIWVVDDIHVLSYTQVKEMGIVVKNNPQIASDLKSYFEIWWTWSDNIDLLPSINATLDNHRISNIQTSYFNNRFQQRLVVPCFSFHADESDDCLSPFLNTPQYTTMSLPSDPIFVTLNNLTSNYFISGAPQEANFNSFGNSPDRAFDEEMILNTILDAEEYVHCAVMDFMPVSQYDEGHSDQPVLWDAFFQTLNQAATSKKINVKILVSYWTHTDERQIPYLQALLSYFSPCKIFDWSFQCEGNIEIRVFQVPGWNETGTEYPNFSRVNHNKYMVTDNTFNIGTSNWVWGYFFQTAGASFNSNHTEMRSTLQQVFNRDWNSQYVENITDFVPNNNI